MDTSKLMVAIIGIDYEEVYSLDHFNSSEEKCGTIRVEVVEGKVQWGFLERNPSAKHPSWMNPKPLGEWSDRSKGASAGVVFDPSDRYQIEKVIGARREFTQRLLAEIVGPRRR